MMFVEPEGRCGPENMAIDESLLVGAHRTGTAFLRLYRWDPPCLSFGRNEPAAARYDRAAIERRGLPVVRRPTGGRAVWHEHEVTYAVAAPIATFGSLRESYRAIHERLAAALRSLGADAQLAARPRRTGSPLGRARLPASQGSCFAAAAGGEILVGGRKVVGSAQVRRGTAFLQHGSILLDGSQDIVRAVSRQRSAARGETSLRAALGRRVTFDEVAEAIVQQWRDVIAFAVPRRPPPSSAVLFADPAWTWRR